MGYSGVKGGLGPSQKQMEQLRYGAETWTPTPPPVSSVPTPRTSCSEAVTAQLAAVMNLHDEITRLTGRLCNVLEGNGGLDVAPGPTSDPSANLFGALCDVRNLIQHASDRLNELSGALTV